MIEELRAEAGQENAPPDIQERLKAAEARQAINREYPKAKDKIAELMPKKARSEQAYQSVKADLDSISSFYDIEVDEHGKSEKAKEYYDRIQALKKKVADAQAAKDDIMAQLKDEQVKTDLYEAPLTAAISNWKKVTDKFDAQVKLALSKQWTFGDALRTFPVIDGFPVADQDSPVHDQRHPDRLQLQIRHPLRPLHDVPPGNRSAGVYQIQAQGTDARFVGI